MHYDEDEYLALSGVQHFAFCRRQWALIHIEQMWTENYLTTDGELMHQHAHNEESRERRGNKLILRGLAVFSPELGLSGKCDVVEFRQTLKGHPLVGEDGLWAAVPVEYKHGTSKMNDADRMQLCAQAMCLEEMFVCDIAKGYLFYGKTKKREEVVFEQDLREKVVNASDEMHRMYKRRYTPKVKPFAACRSCSLYDDCLPRAMASSSAISYVDAHLEEIDEASA